MKTHAPFTKEEFLTYEEELNEFLKKLGTTQGYDNHLRLIATIKELERTIKLFSALLDPNKNQNHKMIVEQGKVGK